MYRLAIILLSFILFHVFFSFSFFYQTYFWGSILEALEPFLQARSSPLSRSKIEAQNNTQGPNSTSAEAGPMPKLGPRDWPALPLLPRPQRFPFFTRLTGLWPDIHPVLPCTLRVHVFMSDGLSYRPCNEIGPTSSSMQCLELPSPW